MQDEPIDDIIREAAAGHQPAFEDKAWEAMRQKLDTHLPQKARRQRYLLLLLLVVVGGSAAYWLWRPSGDKWAAKDIAPTVGAMPVEQSGPTAPSKTGLPAAPQLQGDTVAMAAPGATTAAAQDARPVPATINNRSAKQDSKGNDNNIVDKGKRSYSKGQSQMIVGPGVADVIAEAEEEPLEVTADRLPVGIIATTGETDKPADALHLAAWLQEDTLAKPVVAKTATEAANKAAPKKTAAKKGFGSHWLLLTSAGADMSYLRLSNSGKTTLLYGAGLGYTIGKRLMVRAGIYSVEKIYSGNKSDYELPPPAASNPYLYQIDGRCRVYEIPVGLSYYFGQQKHHRWFAAAGLATMLMKTEQYDYHYKSASGVNYTRSYGIRDVNQHYFSILSLSGGYQYQLNNRLAVLAEPYIKLPLNGLGLGKVRLQGMGVMVTVAFRPFGKN